MHSLSLRDLRVTILYLHGNMNLEAPSPYRVVHPHVIRTLFPFFPLQWNRVAG